MKSPLLPALLVLAFAAGHGIAAEKPAPATRDKPADVPETATAIAPETDKDEPKKKMIEKGMNGAEITELFGKPAEIKPIESPTPDTKAEQWIYRRKIKDTTVQVAVGTRMVSTYTGPITGGQMVDRPEPIYRTKIIGTFQVTALLMVNDKLEIAKQWAEQDEALQ